MTDLQRFFDSIDQGRVPVVDWGEFPWGAAQPCLHWLGLAPPATSPMAVRPLDSEDAALVCDRIARRFEGPDGMLAWSSAMLESALAATAVGVGSVPEPLVGSVWRLLQDRSLTRDTYEMCRALGRELLGRYRGDPRWDLGWMLGPASPAQLCQRYWTLGLRPGLWDSTVERTTMEVLRQHPFAW